MAQVSNEAALRAALNDQEPTIQITADIMVGSQLPVRYPVTVSSAGTDIFTLKKSASFPGYLFRVADGGALTLQSIILDGAQAGHYSENPENRSLVMVAGGTLRLESGAVLQNNSSYQEGGGVYLSGDPAYINSFIMAGDARIRGCSSRTSGGGFMAALRNPGDNAVFSESCVIENNTAANGGGLYFRSYLQNVGGALIIQDTVRILENSAASTGGGICFSGFRDGNGPEAVLTVTGNVVISSNTAGTHGGGLYFWNANSGDRLTLHGAVSIIQNTASGNGGGIFLTAPRGNGALVMLDEAMISGNTAGNGGGLYLLTATGGTLEITGGSFTENNAVNSASGTGGGLWFQNTSAAETLSLSVQNVFIGRNAAAAQGGGIAFFAGPAASACEISGSVLSGNSAGTNGGALLVGSGGGSFAIRNSEISSNQAGGSGGGMYLANTANVSSSLIMSDVVVRENSAGMEGGGLRLTSGTGSLETILESCSIAQNTADASSGGGVWNGGTNNSLQIRQNTVITQNSTGAGNGGGIYLNGGNNSLLLAEDAKVTNNRADSQASLSGNRGGGLCVIRGRVLIQDQAEIAYNSALKYGGGISAAENSNVTVTGGSLHDNHSDLYGGGIWNHDGSILALEGGSLYANSAQAGGGIYNDTDSTAIISGGIFGQPPNSAANHAPGIYNAGVFRTEGERELSNGLYIEKRGAAAQLVNGLTSGSAIQLDNSGYVSPNPDGTPIVVAEGTADYSPLHQTDADAFQKPPADFDGWEIRLSGNASQVLLAPAVYTLSYENLMGAENPNPDSYTVTTPDIILAVPGSIPGYRFSGWFDAPEDGKPVTDIPQGSTGSKVLYARWEPVFFTVTYYGNDEEGPFAQQIPPPLLVQENDSATLSDAVPIREGYTFTGWNTDPLSLGTTYQPGQRLTDITGDMSLYAQWRQTPAVLHTITYLGNDCGCCPARCLPCPQQVPHCQNAFLSMGVPQRCGYRFLGWNTSPTGTGTWYPPGATIQRVSGDIRLFAQWKACWGPCCHNG